MLQCELFSYPPSSINLTNSPLVTGCLAIWNALTTHSCAHFSWPNTKGSVFEAPRRGVDVGTEIHAERFEEGVKEDVSAVAEVRGGGGNASATTDEPTEVDDEENGKHDENDEDDEDDNDEDDEEG